MSAYTDVASTAGAFRGGAHEFLSKPFDLDDAVALARRVLAQHDADDGETQPEPEPVAEPESDALVGDPPAMRPMFRALGRRAPAPLSVLVPGENVPGTQPIGSASRRGREWHYL